MKNIVSKISASFLLMSCYITGVLAALPAPPAAGGGGTDFFVWVQTFIKVLAPWIVGLLVVAIVVIVIMNIIKIYSQTGDRDSRVGYGSIAATILVGVICVGIVLFLAAQVDPILA